MKQNSTTNGDNMVKRTERGWITPLPNAEKCYFRRNTLLEYNGEFIVVITLGRLMIAYDGFSVNESLEYWRYYETKAFYTYPFDLLCCNVDKGRQIDLDCDWYLDKIDDFKANDMHEKAVDWISRQMIEHKPFKICK